MYCDCRIGGIEKWYAEKPWHADMRIPPALLKCVLFLCAKNDTGKLVYGGTACFVSVPAENDPEFVAGYIVTAKHCVERGIRDYGELYIRINLSSGNTRLIALPNRWQFPDDTEADVAVLAWTGGIEGTDLEAWPLEAFATEEEIAARNIGLGDELFSLGLFQQRYGTMQNIPILRTGVIASMPTEPIQDALSGKHFQAYLVELRSIGGLSGSPVFAYLSNLGRPVLNLPPSTSWEILLLGIIRGHWEIDQSIKGIDLWGDETSSINTGIALVTPASDIVKVLRGDDLKKQRRHQSSEWRKTMAPVLDSGFGKRKNPDSQTGEPFTKADFEAALKKVARKTGLDKPT